MAKMRNPRILEKREELQKQIEIGKYMTILDVFSDKVGRKISRMAKKTKSPPFWVSTTVVILVVLAIDILLSVLFGEFSIKRRELLWVELAVSVVTIGGLVLFNAYLKHAYDALGKDVINSIESMDDLVNLEDWLKGMARTKSQMIFGIGYALLVGLPVMLIAGSLTGHFLGFGPITLFVAMSMPAAIVMWYIAQFLALLVRMSRYQFDFYIADPSESKIIKCLSALMNRLMLLLAILMTIFTLLVGSFRGLLLSGLGMFFLLFSWGPIILLFVFSQVSLQRIIATAKNKILLDLQRTIDNKIDENILTDEETIATDKKLVEINYINELMDYYDRIRSSRNTAIDFRAGINLFNSLLLPLLAFILANFEKIKNSFSF